MKTFFLRLVVILFWAAFILGLLYLPSLSFFSSKEKKIRVFAWGDILDPTVIAEFERKSGIKVHLSYYSSNEELIVKMLATKGEGYDLIIPSDYSVKILKDNHLLKPLQKEKLSVFSNINPALLGHPFDPQNEYSIPFEWEVFVLGIDKTFFQNRPLDPSWKMIFDPSLISYRIAMLSDPIQALLLASFYLYGPVDTISSQQLQETIRLLSLQKTWVTAYADFRADYFLASKNCPVVVSSSSYLIRTMKRFSFVDFVVPQEGTFVTIENFCIPISSQKEELSYELIQFLYRPESMATHFKTYGVFPSTLDVTPLLDLEGKIKDLFYTSTEDFKKFSFTHLVSSQQAIRDAWIQVKLSEE